MNANTYFAIRRMTNVSTEEVSWAVMIGDANAGSEDERIYAAAPTRDGAINLAVSNIQTVEYGIQDIEGEKDESRG